MLPPKMMRPSSRRSMVLSVVPVLAPVVKLSLPSSFPSPANVVSSAPAVVSRTSAKSFTEPVRKMSDDVPPSTIAPSGCTSTAFAMSCLSAKSTVARPSLLKVVSSVPFSSSTATAMSNFCTPLVEPATTMRSSSVKANDEARSSSPPKSTVARPSVSNDGSSVPFAK